MKIKKLAPLSVVLMASELRMKAPTPLDTKIYKQRKISNPMCGRGSEFEAGVSLAWGTDHEPEVGPYYDVLR